MGGAGIRPSTVGTLPTIVVTGSRYVVPTVNGFSVLRQKWRGASNYHGIHFFIGPRSRGIQISRAGWVAGGGAPEVRSALPAGLSNCQSPAPRGAPQPGRAASRSSRERTLWTHTPCFVFWFLSCGFPFISKPQEGCPQKSTWCFCFLVWGPFLFKPKKRVPSKSTHTPRLV